MVDDWIVALHRKRRDYSMPPPGVTDLERARLWAANHGGIEDFDPKQPGASYPDVYWHMFRDHPEEGQAYLEQRIKLD